MRVDLLYHYAFGQVLGWFNQTVLHLSTTDNAIVSQGLMVAKELTDKTGFDVLDIVAGSLGWAVQVLH